MAAAPSPRADCLLARLRELDRADDALELRIAMARQSLKAAEAHVAAGKPDLAHPHLHRGDHRLRAAG